MHMNNRTICLGARRRETAMQLETSSFVMAALKIPIIVQELGVFFKSEWKELDFARSRDCTVYKYAGRRSSQAHLGV